MFSKEEFPKEFQDTTLHMIFKGGVGKKRESLDANRFIHSKGFFARAAEGLIVEDGLETPLLAGSSMFQIGGHGDGLRDEVCGGEVQERREDARHQLLRPFKVF